MIKKILQSVFLKEAALYGLMGVISKFAPIIIIPIYISFIGLEGFGLLDLYITIGLAVFIVCEAQAVSGVMRSYYESKENGTLEQLVGSAIKIYIFTYIALLVVFLLASQSTFESKLISYDYLLPIVAVVFPRQVFALCTLILRMEHKAKEYIFLSLFNVLLTALLGMLAVYWVDATALAILYGICLSQVVSGAIAYWRINKVIKIQLSKKYVKDIIYYGVPIAISTLAGWLLASSGRLVLADSATDFELGVYSLSLKIAMIFMVLLQAFRTAWDPYCMKKFGEKNSVATFSKSLNIYWLFASTVIVCIYFLSPFLISLLGAEESALNKNLILLILLGYLWQGSINIIAVGNAWVRKTYINSLGTIIGGGLSLLLSVLLVHNLGVLAGGIGYLVGLMASFTIIYNIAQKNVMIPYNIKWIFFFFLLSASFIIYILHINNLLYVEGYV
jgi:O-antigen/teichoic acid export membrane protein